MKFLKIHGFHIPLENYLSCSLPSFKQLSLLTYFNLSSISKVMTICSFSALNFGNWKIFDNFI